MNRINRQIALSLLLLLVSSITYAQAYRGNPPTEEQVQKLAAAAWKERPHSIDVTFYLEFTTHPKPVEQIRQEVEEIIDQGDQEYYKRKGWTKDSLPDYAAKRRKRAIEMTFNRAVERQRYPRLIKKRIMKEQKNGIGKIVNMFLKDKDKRNSIIMNIIKIGIKRIKFN